MSSSNKDTAQSHDKSTRHAPSVNQITLNFQVESTSSSLTTQDNREAHKLKPSASCSDALGTLSISEAEEVRKRDQVAAGI